LSVEARIACEASSLCSAAIDAMAHFDPCLAGERASGLPTGTAGPSAADPIVAKAQARWAALDPRAKRQRTAAAQVESLVAKGVHV
jgi:hypothetical protein